MNVKQPKARLRMGILAALTAVVVAGAVAAKDSPPAGAASTCAAGVWQAEFFAGSALSGAPLDTRCVTAIDEAWGQGGPQITNAPSNNFSVRYTMTNNYAAGTHQFNTISDDGVQVIVDAGGSAARTVINNWTDHSVTSDAGSLNLPAGAHTFTVNYYERTGNATVKVLHTSPPSGSALYVATNGNDSSAGTLTAPVRTIQTCLNRVQPGYTCFVRGGTYDESLSLKTSGSLGARISVKSYQGESVTVRSGTNFALRTNGGKSYYTIDGLRFISQFVAGRSGGTVNFGDPRIGNNYNVIRNCYIEGSIQIYGHDNVVENCELNGTHTHENGIHDWFAGSHHNTYRSNTVYNYVNRGIWTMKQTDHTLIEKNVVHDIGPGNRDTPHGIDCDGFDVAVTNCVVRNNTVYNMSAGAILLEDAINGVVERNLVHDARSQAIDVTDYGKHPTTLSHIVVRNNVVYKSQHGIHLDVAGGQIYNNTISGSTDAAIRIGKVYDKYCSRELDIAGNIVTGSLGVRFMADCSPGPSTVRLRNNIYYNGSSNITHYWAGTRRSLSQVLAAGHESGSRNTDPLFVDSGSNNFHLRTGSPAAGAGIPLPGVVVDKDGKARANPPSIGGFE
jgi:parallel beta-helix repeat protein